jgi:hypothetical protein
MISLVITLVLLTVIWAAAMWALLWLADRMRD